MIKRRLSIFPALLATLLLVLTPAMTAHGGLMGERLTIRQENEMGRNFDLIVRSQMPMVGDTYITDYVAKLVANVVKAKRPMPFRVKSAVIANPILNAFAIPGGYIYIFTGLIQEVRTESELIGVIAHELAHVSERHVASRLEKQQALSMLSTAGTLAGLFLGMAVGGSNAAQAGQAIAMGASGMATAAMLQYSQADEREADHVGMNSLVKAGYNPAGMPGTFEVMVKNRWFDTGRSQMPSYLSTHPGLNERITYLNDRIKRMPTVFTERKDDNTELERIQVLVRAKMSPAKTALAYWNEKNRQDYKPMDYIGRGIALERLKDMDDARESYEQALHLDGEDPLVVREAGIFYFKIGEDTKAFKLLQKATIKNKRDALGLFYLSQLQARAKKYAQAIDTMNKVLVLVPEDGEVHHHMGMITGESGDEFHGNLHLAYAGVYSSNLRKAAQHYRMADALAETDAQKKELELLANLMEARANLGK